MSSMRQSGTAALSDRPGSGGTADAPIPKPGQPVAGAWRRDVLRRRMLAGADAATIVAVVLAFGFERGTTVWLAGYLLLVALAGVVTAKVLGLYDRDHRVLWHTTADELAEIATWSAIVTAGFVVGPGSAADPGPQALGIVGFIGVTAVLDVGLRSLARRLWRQATPPERVLIVGSGPLEKAVRRKFELFHHLHVEVVASVNEERIFGLIGGGTPGDLFSALGVASDGVDRLVLAASSPDERLVAKLVPYCRRHEIKLGLVPPARGMFGTAVQLDHVAELPIIQYNTWDVSRSTLQGKRVLDVVVSAVLLTLMSPLLLLVAGSVKLDSRGPMLFRQRRAGQHGRPFMMVKFRSMTADAESRVSEVVELEDLAEPMFKLRRDPRVTRVGRRLRRSSIDELPQLWNVMLGHMSLVGPRPEELGMVERYPSEIRQVRLALKPGLTGPMQVFGRGELTFDERVAVEREYVENLSLRRDVRILGMTLSAVVRRQGAF